MSDPNKVKPIDVRLSPFTDIPLLTDGQKKTLTEQKDRGITQAGIRRFSTFESWQRRVRNSSGNLGFFQGLPQAGEEDFSIFTPYREFPAFQRLAVLRPDLVAELGIRIEVVDSSPLDEETDRMLWESYELMADLTDINDTFGKADKDMRLPSGQIDPNYLMR
ncbi:MAG TPA: hypothetical protein VGF75_03085 [Candidatus Saccharimonadales bacterium]|jgi:hypothetical protein